MGQCFRQRNTHINWIDNGAVLHNQIFFGSGVNGGALWELKANGSGEKVVLSNIPKFEGSVSFAKDDTSDLHSLLENHYCVPDHTNFPTVDSFVALRNPFCDLKNNELCLVGFQTTTGEKKHLKVVGGRRIRTKFQDLCSETLNTSNMYMCCHHRKECTVLAKKEPCEVD